MNKTIVIYHSADFDGLFCREIARNFLPDAELIGWDFKDKPLSLDLLKNSDQVYIMDLPVNRVFGDFVLAVDGDDLCFLSNTPPPTRIPLKKFIWIDHHIGSIQTHPGSIPGYRIDGVAACRLAWQYFTFADGARNKRPISPKLPEKQHYVDHIVSEPLAVRLAGEYDVNDKRDPRAAIFQHGLRSQSLGVGEWGFLLKTGLGAESFVDQLLDQATTLQYARTQEYAEVIKTQGFNLQFECLNFLACNSHNLDIRSALFEAGIKPEHDALLGFSYNGNGTWRVSMYRIPGKDTDIIAIAKKHGGGGHIGACGFNGRPLPFQL